MVVGGVVLTLCITRMRCHRFGVAMQSIVAHASGEVMGVSLPVAKASLKVISLRRGFWKRVLWAMRSKGASHVVNRALLSCVVSAVHSCVEVGLWLALPLAYCSSSIMIALCWGGGMSVCPRLKSLG